MGKERKCILCEMVCNSKQEMDEHVRSMLHHRELENLKGRDCGHECKVCRVTVVSLTDYASHISSTLHKQNVEASESKNAENDQDEDYFDKALVDLIEKRKELIRIEEKAAAAKRVKEEERRRMQEFEQRLKEAKERFRKDCALRQPPRGFSRDWQEALNGNSFTGGRQCDAQAASRHWHHSGQGKSATWHAQEPPNFNNWESEGQWAGGSLHSQQFGGDRRWEQGAFSGNQRGRLPWLSNGGSSNGLYGRNNIPQCPTVNRPMSLFGPINGFPPPPTFFARAIGQVQNQGNGQEGRQGDGYHNKEGPNAERDRNNGMGPKTFGSNPKLDKACRWSPYPPTKLFDSAPQKDTHPSPSEKYSKAPTSQKRETAPATNPSNNRQSQLEQKPRQSSSPGDNVEGKRKRNKGRKNRDRSSSSSRSSSAQRDGQKTNLPGPSKQRTDKPSEPRDNRLSVTSTFKSQLKRASSQESEQSKTSCKHSGSGSKSSHSAVLQSVQDQQLAEILKNAKETMLDKRGSVDISTDNRMETVLHITEEQQRERPESQVGANKENKSGKDGAKAPMPELIRPSPCGEEKMKSGMPSSDSCQSLQSVQVSTSTMESSAPVASTREDEEEGGRKQEEEGRGLVATDEAMQAVEAGQGSESNVSLRSSEVQMTSGSTAPGLNKLGLPLVLKRDLTKHISSKSKAASHEPNLNSARRVRNVSESRRVEAEKESGLKPTVRQLISSSGARRNVNWEQVYQEVCRKKQEQGKGMPRFGIEMVSHDTEELNQEGDDIPLIEGFQWEMLLDAPSIPRKRCLSESSIAPDCSSFGRALFSTQTPGERSTREGLCRPGRGSSELEGSSPPNPISAYGNGDNLQQQDEERGQGQCEPKGQKQPDGTSKRTEKTLQREESVLGDSSSGTELYDVSGTGKKRRAAGDIPNPEIPSMGRKNKRRKIKSKKERFQVDQLLAVSLREEELSHSLQTVDNSLIQARAALQAAFMEVQRLMVVKQQMSDEMSSLRNRRIDLLKGMQGDLEGAAKIRVKEEPMDSITAEPDVAPLLSPLTDDAAVPSPSHAYQVPQCASPPSSTLPFTPVIVKQEPRSPVRIHTQPDPEEETVHCAHSTTPELPVPPVSTSHTDTVACQLSPERTPELHKANAEPTQESFGAAAECKDSSLDVVQSVDSPLQVESKLNQTDSISPAMLSLASRRSSEAGSLADPSALPSYEPSSVPLVPSVPLSPSELRSGKRVRKLKKRRVLKKAQAVEPAENSDTELETESMRPVRRLRPRRRSSGGSHVSTSTLPTAVEDEEGDKAKERHREEEEEASGPLSPASKPEQEDSDSSLEMVELPQAAPAAEVVNVDSSDPEDGSMEVTMAFQDAQTDGQTPATAPAPDPTPTPTPDTSTAETQNLACNEVTSTSEMDVSPVVKPYESDVQMPLALPNMSKTSSEDAVDVTSDPGEDDTPTQGAFEGHQEMVNAMQIHNGLLYTCSGDRTVKAFNLVSRKCVAVFEGHSSKVNCLLVSATPCLQRRLYSGSSDQTIRCYSLKTRECVEQFSLPDRVFCLHSRWHILYAGLANGKVVTFNLKTNKQQDVFECHGPRAVSCLASAQEGARRVLLVGSYDHTISVRDAMNGLLLRTLEGHTGTVLCMKVVNDLVFSGSSDHSVHAHNIHTGELVRIYKGHNHSVTVVAILGSVMVTACLDKLVRVYELQSHNCLQVYGGHNDMVMCMVIHKSMIYTGCYDGSVRAVKLNLTQNYRCLWHGCSMIFGVMEHLQQHLVNDHTNPNFETLKCRWKDCDEFFSTRNGSKQGVPKHMQKHAEESKLEP